VQLDWRLSPIDKYTIQRSQQILAQEFERSGLGQLQIEISDDDTSWPTFYGCYHHMGTTRMSTNPRQGVVNEHCQVHGISNLYIAGSSVFPTGGHSNPTLTIIALAIRLADHIKVRMGCSAGVEQNANFATSKTSVAVK
jgi:choline dehydrogenase-like flavoprotein